MEPPQRHLVAAVQGGVGRGWGGASEKLQGHRNHRGGARLSRMSVPRRPRDPHDLSCLCSRVSYHGIASRKMCAYIPSSDIFHAPNACPHFPAGSVLASHPGSCRSLQPVPNQQTQHHCALGAGSPDSRSLGSSLRGCSVELSLISKQWRRE